MQACNVQIILNGIGAKVKGAKALVTHVNSSTHLKVKLTNAKKAQ
jgi:hypothetical protein